jgi:hypothetical protein
VSTPTDLEGRLRDAADARARAVEPDDEGGALRSIEATIASRRRRMKVGFLSAAAAALVVAVVAGLAVARVSDSATVTVAPTTDPATTLPPTTAPPTTVGTTTTPPTTSPPVAPLTTAIFPFGAGGTRYDTPELAAKAFAVTMLGNPDAVARPSTATADTDVRAVRIDPLGAGYGQMTVEVTHAPAGDWVVTGSQSDDIDVNTVDRASDGSITVTGMSVAFEASFRIEVRDLATGAVVSESHVMGGSTDKQPFTATLAAPTGTGPYALVALVPDMSGRAITTSATVSFLAA